MNEDALLALTSLLLKVHELAALRPCSLARLAKQSGRPMSVLLRELTALEEMGLAERDAASGAVGLTRDGHDFCKEVHISRS